MAHNEHKLILYFICHYCRPLEGGTVYYVSQRATNEYRQEHYIRDFVYKLKTMYHITFGMIPSPDWRPYTEDEKRHLYNRAIAQYKRLGDKQKSMLKHDATKGARQRVYRHNRQAFVKGYKIARGWYDHYQEEYASGGTVEKTALAREKHHDEEWYGVMEALKEDIGRVTKSGHYVTIYTRDIKANLDWHIGGPAIHRILLELGARYAQIYDSALKSTLRGYYLPIHVYNQVGGHTIEEKVDRPWQRLIKRGKNYDMGI